MSRIGVFLTRRQIAKIRQLLVVMGYSPTNSDIEMADLRRRIDKEYVFVQKDKEAGWGGNYEWGSGDERDYQEDRAKERIRERRDKAEAEVDCPFCHAQAGSPCTRNGRLTMTHATRVQYMEAPE
jgi:hypothetical protein